MLIAVFDFIIYFLSHILRTTPRNPLISLLHQIVGSRMSLMSQESFAEYKPLLSRIIVPCLLFGLIPYINSLFPYCLLFINLTKVQILLL